MLRTPFVTLVAVLGLAGPAEGAVVSLVAAPDGGGTACSTSQPCSITQAFSSAGAVAETDEASIFLLAGDHTASTTLQAPGRRLGIVTAEVTGGGRVRLVSTATPALRIGPRQRASGLAVRSTTGIGLDVTPASDPGQTPGLARLQVVGATTGCRIAGGGAVNLSVSTCAGLGGPGLHVEGVAAPGTMALNALSVFGTTQGLLNQAGSVIARNLVLRSAGADATDLVAGAGPGTTTDVDSSAFRGSTGTLQSPSGNTTQGGAADAVFADPASGDLHLGFGGAVSAALVGKAAKQDLGPDVDGDRRPGDTQSGETLADLGADQRYGQVPFGIAEPGPPFSMGGVTSYPVGGTAGTSGAQRRITVLAGEGDDGPLAVVARTRGQDDGTWGTSITLPEPGTTYRVAAELEVSGQVSRVVRTLTTRGAAPVVTAEPATEVTQTSAALAGSVVAGAAPQRVTFTLVSPDGDGRELAAVDVPAGDAPVRVTATATGLAPGTEQQVAMTARGTDGQGASAFITFTTLPSPPPSPPPPVVVPPPPVRPAPSAADVRRAASAARTAVGRVLTSRAPRRLGASLPASFVSPLAGRLTVRLTIPASVARRLRARGLVRRGADAVLGTATTTLSAGRTRTTLRLSSASRTLLRRRAARGLRVRLAATFVAPGAAGQTSSTTLRLRR